MIFLRALLIFILLINGSALFGQSIDPSALDKLEIEQKSFKNYFSKSGHTIGCDWNLECAGFGVKFYSLVFDSLSGSLHIKGRVYLDVSRIDSANNRHPDSLGVRQVYIFLATPYKRTLKEVPNMFTFSYSGASGFSKALFPLRGGDFDCSFTIKNGQRLYFAGGGNYFLKEYDIGKLFRNKR